MSDIKVGDICVVVRASTALELIGTEVEVLEPESLQQREVGHFLIVQCYGFVCRSLATGKKHVFARKCLRKKGDKKPTDAEPRTDFTPADSDFSEDLQRRLTKETA